MKPPFAYSGGKTLLAERIVALFPPHTHYVEPFFGSGAVLMAKPPSRLETVNDIDGDLMHFWRILRERQFELIHTCALTPHSRSEYELSFDRPADLDDLERARRVWVCLSQGRTGTMRTTGWRFDTADNAHTSMPNRLAGYVARMDAVVKRLASVSLECRPAMEVIDAYGGYPESLLYVDPPYLGSVRKRNYRHEMGGEAEHRELASALNACRATVVLSGYASPLYQEMFAGWHVTSMASATSQGGTWGPRTEVLWCNRPPADTLFGEEIA